MGQVTQATIDMIITHTQRGEMPPLTVWEVQQLATHSQRYQAIHAMSEKLAGKVKLGEGYPEGFDESCGVPAFAMRYANMALASTIGDRDWDVPCVASAITGPLRDLRAELNKMKWSGADEGWDLAIEAVRKHISEILDVKQPAEGEHA
ncbi:MULTISPECIES: hypothetical protein [unclassified Herbaspirillum]|uniref:hypothetical protein n=1 Tax=unclassified Herbaspirillum TaxID=2624150 RepID=UPI000C0FA3D8|nr:MULTISPECIES: hypothetical protein [unclassified Herbaspirillum]MBO15575.1 hypothetical protein [Herbaspirillum sp.]|tara:strand:- start:7 stop:453 length:447 start_codon:yes stop_codon:yes gene_type:complete